MMIMPNLSNIKTMMIGLMATIAAIIFYGKSKKNEGKSEAKNKQIEDDAGSAKDAKKRLEKVKSADAAEFIASVRDSEQ